MKMPFLHRSTLVLKPLDTCVEWTYLTTLFKRKTQYEEGKLQLHMSGRWKDVAVLIQQRQWQHAQIIVQINSIYVRYFIIQGPVAESKDEFDQWMSDEIAVQLPVGADIEDFVCRSSILHYNGDAGDDVMQCLVGLAHKEAVEKELQALQGAGLSPAGFSGSIVEIKQLIHEQIPGPSSDKSATCDEHLSVTLNDQLTGENCIAGLGIFNFLEEEQIKVQTRYSEKQQAIKLVLVGGSLLAGLLVILLVLQALLTSRLKASEENLLLMGEQIGVLEQHRKTIHALNHQLQQAQHFMGARTSVAGILMQVGKSIPEDVWLNQFLLSKAKDNHWVVALQGVALEAQQVALLLSRLEQLDHVLEVELILSEAMPVQELYKKEKLQRMFVTRFEVMVTFPSPVNKLYLNSPIQNSNEMG